jgi:hypothetical protein
LMALGLRRLPARTARIAAVATLGAVFVVNLLGSVLPQHDASDDYWRHRADWYEREGRPGDLVIADGYIWISYLRYFAHEQVLDAAKLRALPRTAVHKLYTTTASTAHVRRVLLSGSVTDPASDDFSSCSEVPEACAAARPCGRPCCPEPACSRDLQPRLCGRFGCIDRSAPSPVTRRPPPRTSRSRRRSATPPGRGRR